MDDETPDVRAARAAIAVGLGRARNLIELARLWQRQALEAQRTAVSSTYPELDSDTDEILRDACTEYPSSAFLNEDMKAREIMEQAREGWPSPWPPIDDGDQDEL